MSTATPTHYPTLVPVPDRLEGKRIVLRPLEVEDAPAVFQAVEESRPRLVDWVPWAKAKQKTLEEEIDYCVKCKAQWVLREALYVGIFGKDDGRFLGGAGFHPAGRASKIDWSFPSIELGYWIRTGEEGKGYVAEAVELMCRLAFETLHAPRVAAHCDPTNARSVRVIERAGFVLEGILRNENRWWDGGLGDTCVFSMLPEEWRARAARNRAAEGGQMAAPTAPLHRQEGIAMLSAPSTAGDRPGVIAIPMAAAGHVQARVGAALGPPDCSPPSGTVAAPATAHPRKIVPPGPLPTTIEVPERIEGDRVVVRAWTADDAEALFQAVEESRPRLQPWMPWANDHKTVEESRDFCLRSIARWMLRTSLFCAVFRKSDGRLLGGTGLHGAGTPEIDWSIPKFEIGYWIRTGEEGKGYVAEAVRLVTRLAFETLHARRVQIHCDVRNTRSVRVMEAAGYIREAVFRHDSLAFDGSGIRDTAAYALTDDDWARRPRP